MGICTPEDAVVTFASFIVHWVVPATQGTFFSILITNLGKLPLFIIQLLEVIKILKKNGD